MTSTNTGPNAGLFEVLQPAPYRVTSTHHEAYALLPAIIMVGVTAIVVLVKIYTSLTIFKKLRMDDYAVAAAMVCACSVNTHCKQVSHILQGFFLAYTVTLGLAVRHGIGRASDALGHTQTQLLSQVSIFNPTNKLVELIKSSCISHRTSCFSQCWHAPSAPPQCWSF